MDFSYFEVGLDKVVWVGADPHLNHKMLVQKKFRPEDYTKAFLNFWKSNVGEDDWVIILGDWCFGSVRRCKVYDLPGERKILVRGNHDHLRKGAIFKYGFDWITDYVLARVYIKPGEVCWILFSHKRVPLKYWKSIPVSISINIHGHSHKSKPLYDRNGRYINANVEYFNYGLVRLRDLLMRKI